MIKSTKHQCPFCGSTELLANYWHLDSADEEVPALECSNCLAGAPLSSWEKYAPKPLESVKDLGPITVDDWNNIPKKIAVNK